MKRADLLIVFLLLPSLMLVAEGEKRIMEGLVLRSQILGQEVKYSIVLPPDYFKGKKLYPVVYLLHGLGDDESSWLEYGRIAQIADDAVAHKEIVPMIFVMPQGFRNYYVNDYAGTFLYEDMFIKELVPFVDQHYRTIPDKTHRAVMGYSMGGFGALVLPVRYPETFSISVPLSISFRTDNQYMVEDGSEWDNQWGRLFGGVGTTGMDRITEYYKEYSPFHFFMQRHPDQFKDLKLYIDNGDDEHTLCRSNEELHILLRDREIAHEFRVRDGGHEFTYWRDALPNALRFISDGFEGKVYRGDEIISRPKARYPKSHLVQKDKYQLVLPPDYESASRAYPVVYLFGVSDPDQLQTVAGMVYEGMMTGSLPPVILVFLEQNEKNLTEEIIGDLESGYAARKGYRFRALVGFAGGGVAALRNALIPETFTSCVIFDSEVDTDALKNAIVMQKAALKRTWFFISVTDTDKHYASNGLAHMLLRDEDIYHEYRVVEGGRGNEWMETRFKEAIAFTSEKIHR